MPTQYQVGTLGEDDDPMFTGCCDELEMSSRVTDVGFRIGEWRSMVVDAV